MSFYQWLSCVPPTSTHHHKKIVKVGGFSKLADKPELVDAKSTLDALLIPHQIKAPILGPVRLTLAFYFPWRSSEPKRHKSRGYLPHTSRPDCSNLAKTLEDRLVQLRFIEDDASVSELVVSKAWSDEPGIIVKIESLRNDWQHIVKKWADCNRSEA